MSKCFKIILLPLLLYFVFLYFTVCLGGKVEKKDDVSLLIKKIEIRLKSIKTFYTTFSQELKNPNLEETEKRMGKIYFQKEPLKIRWEVEEPDKEILFIIKDQVLDYFPKENIGYKYSLKDLLKSKVFIGFLTGDINFHKFIIDRLPSCNNGHPIRLKMSPVKPEPSLIAVYMWTDKNFIIKKLQFVDFFNNTNTITFNKIFLNVKLSEKVFELPKDIKIQNYH